jgi:putative adhesin
MAAGPAAVRRSPDRAMKSAALQVAGRYRQLQSASCDLKSAIPTLIAGIAVLAPLAILTGCQLDHTGQPPKFAASDEWTRSYPLAAGGQVQVVNGHGVIDIRGGRGDRVEVRAERVGRAPTEQAARDLVPRIEIREDITPERVLLQTQGLSGIVIGVEVSVNYHLTVPAAAAVRARSANGEVRVTDLSGGVVISSANGQVIGANLSGGVDARAVNGNVTLDLAAFGHDPVQVRATNGSVELSLPAAADANVTATYTNGKIDTGNLKLDLLGEQTRRRLLGRLNAGGAPIEIAAVNGNITLRAR